MRRDVVEMIGVGKAGPPGRLLLARGDRGRPVLPPMRFDPRNITDPDRDRFILSKGHAVLIQYAALVELGVIPREEIDRTKTLEGMLQGHPDMEQDAGHRGGHRLAGPGTVDRRGHGARAAARPAAGPGVGDHGRRGARRGAAVGGGHGRGGVRARTTSPASSTATGSRPRAPPPRSSPSPRIERKWEAFGWNVLTVDGHDVAAVLRALDAARR